MTKTFFISDTHFGQRSMLHFKTKEGLPLRPFDSVEEMDELMVSNWNARVSPDDKVYHLGDVAMKGSYLKILDRLNGRKTLVAGNHDIFRTKIYKKYFENIRAYKMYPKHGIIFSHIPVHPQQLNYKFKFNVHGHLHSNEIEGDNRYLNICVEKTNYKPVTFDEILIKLGIRSDE